MFSIIIPSLNEGYYLNITLDSIFNHVDNELLKEIIIIDDCSEKEDFSFIKNHKLSKKIILIQNNVKKGPSISRNIGAEKAVGDVLIFLDAHMYCDGLNLGKLSKMREYLDKGALQGTVGNFSNKQANGYIYKIKNKLLNSYWCEPYLLDQKDLIITEAPCSAGGFTIIKKEIFEKVGGFNEHFTSWGAEDIDISLRLWLLGFSIFYTNDLYVAHYFKTKFNYKLDSNKVFYNKLIMFKLYFEDDYEKADDMLKEFKSHYGEETYKKVINEINTNNEVLNYISEYKNKFKRNINWYIKKFKNYNNL